MSRHILINPETVPREHRLHDDAASHMLALGCVGCLDRRICGGLRIAASSFSCMDRCCGGSEGCDVVCPRKAVTFAERWREVNGFGLENVPAAPLHPLPLLPAVVPVLFGGTGRVGYTGSSVAIPLFRVLRWSDGRPHFTSMAEMADKFRFVPGVPVVLTATSDDRPLERWWSWGKVGRRQAARALAVLGVGATTSPNFSLFTDRPRYDDLHSIKRIGLTWQEMADEGLPTALHVNARTETDWSGWTTFIAERPEVDAIAFEFATPTRAEWHATHLAQLAESAGRPLRLLVRGGTRVMPILRHAFAQITLLDTRVYMRTIKRQRAYVRSDGLLGWAKKPMPAGAPLDDLFEHNIRSVEGSISNSFTKGSSISLC